MAQLAIRGHKTRGEEIIEILEMLGGKNKYQVTAIRETYVYFVDGGIINLLKINQLLPEQFIVFTLKEFLEEFPYKIGDKVYYNNKICSIIEMLWNSNLNTISYGVYDDKIKNLAIVKELRPYKEETMETDVNDNKTLLNMSAIDYNNGLVGYEIPAGYEFDTVIDNKVVLKKLKSQYPKTYEECCKILGCKANHFFTDFSYNDLDIEISDYEDKIDDLLKNFRKLRYCRDAYWKIVGEQMGLGKSWEPDWTNPDIDLYVIINIYNQVDKAKYGYGFQQCIFTFPTEEIRDVFYENFKELIEDCKELL